MIKENIKQMSAYNPPLEDRNEKSLLLDFNERTISVAPCIKKALINYIKNKEIQRYPNYKGFLEKLSKYVGVNYKQLMITNGSDQGIDILFRATCSSGGEVIIPTPSFPIFNQSANIENLIIKSPVYTKEKGFPTDEVLKNITDKTQLIVICNPNNPTGTLVKKEDIIKIIEASKNVAVFVDECYFEYTTETMKNYVNRYDNLFITRSFSKAWGLASLRLGYIISNEKNIQELLKIRGPYDINQLAIVATSEALNNPQYMQSYVDEIMNISKPMFLKYLRNKKIKYWDSSGNFILIEFSDAQIIKERLKIKGILVRLQKGQNIENTIRITIGTKEEMEKLIGILESIL